MATKADIARKRRLLDRNKELGRRLAGLRKAQGLKQEEIAKPLGFERPLISKIENGHRSLDAVEIPDYAQALGVEPAVIVEIILDVVVTVHWEPES